jgi:endonuclease G
VTGYDAAFLGPDDTVRVPLPATPPGGAPRELRRLDHPNFSILLDPARRLAAATAVTVDGASLRPLRRTGSWRLDPRASEHEQAGPELYHRNALDRGHLVRRRDPMWGSVDAARQAGEATFVYTNAAPQVGRFNQSKELWNGLEDHVLAYAEAHEHRLVVHTGCVFAPDDPAYRGVSIPRRFWKVAAWSTRSSPLSLRAAAFVLDQTPQLEETDLRAVTAWALAVGELPPLGPFRTFQVPVADVGSLAGLELGPLPAADVLPAAGVRPERVPPSGTAPRAWRAVLQVEDLRL